MLAGQAFNVICLLDLEKRLVICVGFLLVSTNSYEPTRQIKLFIDW